MERDVFRVIIAGGRHFGNYDLLKDKCVAILANKMETCDVHIVSGCASGADSLGEAFADEFQLKVDKFPADWDKFGKSARYKRNVQMAENADALIVFWDGKSKGTNHMINIAKEKNLPTRIIKY